MTSPAAARNITPSKLVLTITETMVSDAAVEVQQADTLSDWLMSVQAFVFSGFLTHLPVRGDCNEFGCGTNHIETMVHDPA